MAKKKTTTRSTGNVDQRAETHQVADGSTPLLTTQTGTPISDNQNSLKSGPRGPTLLEDFVLREKITSFDHERIPERIVHARGSGAHGFFQPSNALLRRFAMDDFSALERVAKPRGQAEGPRCREGVDRRPSSR